MTLKVQYPKFGFGIGMNANPGSYGTSKIASGNPNVTIHCGEINNSSIVKIAQIGSSTSVVGPIIEAKLDSSGTYQRVDGLAGQFVVSTADGGNASADINFNWFVLPLGMQ